MKQSLTRNSDSFPSEFLDAFLQANLSPVTWEFPDKHKATTYRNYLLQFRKAYLAENLPHGKYLNRCATSITEHLTSAGITFILTLQKRNFIAPTTKLDSQASLLSQLSQQSGEKVEESPEQLISRLNAEGEEQRSTIESAMEKSNNPYLKS